MPLIFASRGGGGAKSEFVKFVLGRTIMGEEMKPDEIWSDEVTMVPIG